MLGLKNTIKKISKDSITIFKSGAGYLILSKLILSLFRVFEIPLYSSNLGDHNYALWLAFFAGNTLISAGGIGIIPIIVNQTLIDNGTKEDFRIYLSNTLGLSLILIIILSIVQTILLSLAFPVSIDQIIVCFLAYLISAMAGLMVSIMEGVSKIENNYKRFSIFSIFYSSIPVIITFISVYSFQNLNTALLIFTISQMITVSIVFMRMQMIPVLKRVLFTKKEWIFFIKGISHQTYAVIQSFIDILLIAFITYHDSRYVVIYAAIKLLIGFLRQVQNSIIRANSRELSYLGNTNRTLKILLNKVVIVLSLLYGFFLLIFGKIYLRLYVGESISLWSILIFIFYGVIRLTLHQTYILSHYQNRHGPIIVIYWIVLGVFAAFAETFYVEVMTIILIVSVLETVIILFNVKRPKIFGIDLWSISQP